MVSKTSRIVFIDTNIFINCALEEAEKSDLKILEKIIKALQSGKMVLILPEIIQSEIIVNHRDGFDRLKIHAEKYFENFGKEKSKLLIKTLECSRKQILLEIENKRQSTLKIMQDIFKHKNTIKIKLTDALILLGLKRSLLMLPPYSNIDTTKNEDRKREKWVYTKDQDCIAFESLLFYIKSHKEVKNATCIICSHDYDYFDKIGKIEKLKKEIVNDLEKKCSKVLFYSDPLSMLTKQFKAQYSKKQVQEFKTAQLADADLVQNKVVVPFQKLLPEDGVLVNPSIGTFVNPTGTAIVTPWEPFIDQDRFVTMSGLSNQNISLNAKYCPNCGSNIEINFKKFIETDYCNNPTFRFSCPFCSSKLSIKN